jgi:peptide/nickel transport system substrate-binding protein
MYALEKQHLLIMATILSLCIIYPTIVSCADQPENKGPSSLVISTQWDPSTSSGADYGGGVSPYGTNIYEPLVFVDNDMEIQPGLARFWERIDERTWRFYLREGVKFHDGSPFNAKAVLNAFEKWLKDPLFSNVLSSRLSISSLDQIKMVDDYTVDIATTKPLGVLPGRLSNPGLAIVSPEIEEYGKPDGTGPFRFVSMVPMQSLELERNDQYWGEAPRLDKLSIKTILDPSTKVMALESGDIDLIYAVPLSEVSSLQANPDLHVLVKISPRVADLKVNANVDPLNDIRVRQAISYAINKDDLAEHVCDGLARPARSFISPAIAWCDESAGYSHDTDRARQMLSEAGLKDTDGDGYLDRNGKTVSINLTYVPSGLGFQPHYITMAEALQEQLKKVGLKVELKPIEYANYWSTYMGGQYELMMDFNSPWDCDASHLLSDGFGSSGGFSPGLNLTEEHQKKVDALLDEALASSDPKVADKDFGEVQRIVMQEAAVVPLVYEYDVVAAKKSVKGFEIHPLTAWGVTMNDVYLEA